MARSLNDWVKSYIEFTKNTESPLSYHAWVAISTISGVLQRRCFFRWGHSYIYPNQYIILVGPSGQARKGEALTIGKGFSEYIGLTLSADSIIREALIRKMHDNITQYTASKKEIKFQCAISIISKELTVFLGQKDIKFLGDLTDWYDSDDEWTYETKHQGTDRIVGVCLNLLGATAPDWLPSILPTEAVGGGWTSRVIFVVEEKRGKIVENPSEFEIDVKLKKKLEHDLEDIFQMCGEFTFDAEALEMYIQWYRMYNKNWEQGRPPITDPKFDGYLSRRATHIKKVCMALSASRGNDLLITGEDFQRAVKLLEATEKKMPRAFAGLGRARFSDLTEAVLNYIMSRKTCRRSEILRKFYRDIDSWTLEQIERVLSQMKVIEITMIPKDADAAYTFTGAKESYRAETVDQV